MAEGFMRSFDKNINIYSAGTIAEGEVNIYAAKVMAEIGINISDQTSDSVNHFLTKDFDYVITVCDGAKEICPVFTGRVKHRLHFGFEDPASHKGTEEEVLPVYREVRDQIKNKFYEFYKTI
jgi:arsenate reductase